MEVPYHGENCDFTLKDVGQFVTLLVQLTSFHLLNDPSSPPSVLTSTSTHVIYFVIAMFLFLAGPPSLPQFDVQGQSQIFCIEEIFLAKKWYKLPINHLRDLV